MSCPYFRHQLRIVESNGRATARKIGEEMGRQCKRQRYGVISLSHASLINATAKQPTISGRRRHFYGIKELHGVQGGP